MKIQKIRYESFGGVVGTRDPVNLVWVDREYLRSRGFDGGPAWEGPEEFTLRRPLEMEILITERCNLRCPCCYTGADPRGEHVPLRRVAAALEAATALEVFHVAFGGGEPLLHPELLELARLAGRLNLLVSMTTNGTLVDRHWARRAAGLFARVNVSVDVPGGLRDKRITLEQSLAAVKMLREAGITSGVNFILTSRNFSRLGEVFAGAARAGADSVLLLRPKPSGRGLAVYRAAQPGPELQRKLLPELQRLHRRYGIPYHLDCAWAPLMLTAGLPEENLKLLGAYGCIAGSLLVTVDGEGIAHPCSHLPHTMGKVEQLVQHWAEYRRRLDSLARRRQGGRCRSCRMAELCGGGCAAVSYYCGEGADSPDTDLACPVKAVRPGQLSAADMFQDFD